MERKKIVEWVEMNAPRERVFDLVLDVQRRMQLSPLWGITRVEEKSPDYPAEGSRYLVHFPKGQHPDYETVVTGLQPGRKFSYRLQVGRDTHVTWTVQDTPGGTRLTYEEDFLVKDGDEEEFNQNVREVIRRWLQNMKRYVELQERGVDRLIKWFMDRYFLNLRLDQRNVILTVLFMQGVGVIAFVMAAIAMGLASLF